MKPLKLILSAFGSYGGCECVDFEKMQQGLFLITGDTGAGKTTIFDGISYALYGQTSGRRREGDMMRSQYAKDTEETYVEFTFEEGKKIYTVRRSPNWMRRSKRKNKDGEYALTKVSAKVELTLPDGTLYPGKMKETDQKIVEIVGMDMNQFSQVSMISQGDFMKLLLASSKERKEIFSKIFPTEIYWKIQMELKNQERQLFGQLENIRNRCRNEIENVQCIPESLYADAWQEKGVFSEIDNEEVLELLEKMNQEAGEKEKEMQAAVSKYEKLLELYRLSAEQTSRHEKMIKTHQQLESDIEHLVIAVENEKKQLNLVRENYEIAWAQKQHQIVSIRQQMPEYDHLENERLAYRTAAEEGKKIRGQLVEWRASLQNLEQRFVGIQQQQESLKDSAVRKVEVMQEMEKAQEYLSRIQKLLDKEPMWKKGTANLDKIRNELERKVMDYQKASRHYDACYADFIASSAGWMAKTLEEGKPCPVCGSLHHPNPHVPDGKAEMVDQRMVEEARMQREQAQEAVEQFRERFTQISNQMIAYKHEILQEASHFVEEGETLLAAGEFWESITRKHEEIRAQFAVLSEEYLKWKNNTQLYENNQVLLKRIEENMKKGQELIQSAVQKEAVLHAEQKHHENRMHQLMETLVYGSKKEAETIALKLENELGRLKLQLEKQEKQVETNNQMLQMKQGQLEEQKKQLEQMASEKKKAEKAFIDKLNQHGLAQDVDEKQMEFLKKESMKQEKHLYGIRQSNQHIYKHLKEMLASFKDEQSYFAKVRNLSRIANGDVPGAAKIDFQTYMQRRYFKQMVHAANRRLAVMSRNQFLLECRDMNQLGKQGEVGLDLDVYSLVNDQIRDIKTLSGGESFMAALALALGMADVIQQEAGKIHVDTLFIDEGFGSLDENSRNQAVQILGDLAGSERLVGIISHVHELKEQIEQKIQVKKTEHGSRILTCYSE